MPVHCTCSHCGAAFSVDPYRVRDGAVIHCSRSCSYAARRIPPEQRFWAKVDKDGPVPAHCPERGPCWLWTGSTASGYGRFNPTSKEPLGAHVYAYTLTYGPPPSGLHVLHHCDVRLCCNPDHLYAGTPARNVADMYERGHPNHYRQGEGHILAVLTEPVVRSLRASYAAGETYSELAQRTGINYWTLHSAINGKSWKHVT